MAVSLAAQGFTRIFLLGDSGGNQRGMAAVAGELGQAWQDRDVLIAHIPEFYNYGDVLTYQRDVLGIDEDPRLDGLHDDYYITSIIMNDDPRHVRLEQRIRADKATINGISILPAEKTIEHGREADRVPHRSDRCGDRKGGVGAVGWLAVAGPRLRRQVPGSVGRSPAR